MILTESELRELWRDGRHPLPAFPAGTRFSPSAHDFIKDHQLEIRFAEPAPIPLSAPQLPTPAPSASVGVTHYPLPITTYSNPPERPRTQTACAEACRR